MFFGIVYYHASLKKRKVRGISWKIAQVTPTFKEDAKTDPNNYRPISVLPVVNKLTIIERIVFKQLFAYK